MWKITLADGSFLDNLSLSGNNFISQSEITPAMFKGKLGHVLIEYTGNDEQADMFGFAGNHLNMRLDAIQRYPDGWYFVLNEIPADELEKAQNRADLEYVAMMAGVEL